MTTITVDPDNPYFYVKNNALCGIVGNGENVLYVYPAGRKETTYSIPDGVTIITRGAFYMSAIETLNIPASLRVIIGQDATEYLPGMILGVMENLKQVNVDPDNSVYFSVDGVLYSNENSYNFLEKYPAARSRDTFVVPDGINNIFNLEGNFNSLYLPVSVTVFGESFTAKDLYFAGSEAQFKEKIMYIDFDETIYYLSDYCRDNNITVHYNTPAPGTTPSVPKKHNYDVNGSGSPDIMDVVDLPDKILAGSTDQAYDFNDDTLVNILDVVELLDAILYGRAGA